MRWLYPCRGAHSFQAELVTKAYGYGDDVIEIKETIRLNGEGARGLARARIAVRDRATSQVIGTTEGNAPGARGHVGCVEIVRDQAVANAMPVVKVTDPRAYVTHEMTNRLASTPFAEPPTGTGQICTAPQAMMEALLQRDGSA